MVHATKIALLAQLIQMKCKKNCQTQTQAPLRKFDQHIQMIRVFCLNLSSDNFLGISPSWGNLSIVGLRGPSWSIINRPPPLSGQSSPHLLLPWDAQCIAHLRTFHKNAELESWRDLIIDQVFNFLVERCLFFLFLQVCLLVEMYYLMCPWMIIAQSNDTMVWNYLIIINFQRLWYPSSFKPSLILVGIILLFDPSEHSWCAWRMI